MEITIIKLKHLSLLHNYYSHECNFCMHYGPSPGVCDRGKLMQTWVYLSTPMLIKREGYTVQGTLLSLRSYHRSSVHRSLHSYTNYTPPLSGLSLQYCSTYGIWLVISMIMQELSPMCSKIKGAYLTT